jgi:hypothetical protein
VLVATPRGWICRDCEYTQNWAHDFMLSPPVDSIRLWMEKAWGEYWNGPGSPFDPVAS